MKKEVNQQQLHTWDYYYDDLGLHDRVMIYQLGQN